MSATLLPAALVPVAPVLATHHNARHAAAWQSTSVCRFATGCTPAGACLPIATCHACAYHAAACSMKQGYSLLPAHQETVACLLVPIHCCLPTATFLAMWLPESLPAGHCQPNRIPAAACPLLPCLLRPCSYWPLPSLTRLITTTHPLTTASLLVPVHFACLQVPVCHPSQCLLCCLVVYRCLQVRCWLHTRKCLSAHCYLPCWCLPGTAMLLPAQEKPS